MRTYYCEPTIHYNEHLQVHYNRFITGVFLNKASIYMWGAAALL